jgi:23S rRNA (uracil1939-C5)-methyltransferase
MSRSKRGRRAGGAGASTKAIAEGVGNCPVVKNGEYVADVVGIGHDGEGVGRVDGFTLFIPGALPGERVRVKALKLKKQYGYAKLLEVLSASPERVAPPCPIYDKCGGCQLQHLGYDAQLRHKRQLVADALARIGKLRVREGGGAAGEGGSGEGAGAGAGAGGERTDRVTFASHPNGADVSRTYAGDNELIASTGGAPAAHVPAAIASDAPRAEEAGVAVHATLGMVAPWRYRNKAQIPFAAAADREGGLVGGFYAYGSHRIIDLDECLIQHEHNDRIVMQVKRIAASLGVSAYDEATGNGLLRHAVGKIGFTTGEVMVVLVINGLTLPRQADWIRELRETIPGLASICLNVNMRQTNVIFGEETRVLWGSDVIYDAIGDIRFAISARSFYQVNPVQTEVLYRQALQYAGLTGSEIVIDAYCGIGTISLFLAQAARQVYGVELLPEAIDDARRNAELNSIRNVEFAVGRAEDLLPQWQQQGIHADVIVVDPPRKGCDASLLATIVAMRPKRVVYVSCNPATLARDLRILEDGGFRTVEVQPVDMFPHTVHVEMVTLMKLKDLPRCES